jgi:tetratricopeptide (TPR) repeat protein
MACQPVTPVERPAVRFPNDGETVGDFCLLAGLGAGAQGRVFLASQPALADRPVVVKFIPRDGQEHLALARLQHTHIVPLYSVQDIPERGLLALCMPYFGGMTLARLLQAVRHISPDRRSGQLLVEALREAQAAAPVSLTVAGPACQLLARLSYVQAVCWMGTCLADALHYAGERGLVHLDLKPTNVLLAADGQPMLLDFHLAHAPVPAGAPVPERLGGTPAYMAPEHQAALLAVADGGGVRVGVDGRADIYGLGAALYEALGGSVPPPAGRAGRELRQRNPQVTPSLADLLARCLAPDPRERYPSGAALAADLRRYLADFPLQGVRNRSPVERWRRWRRRRPAALARTGWLLGLAAAAILGVIHAGRQQHQARLALEEGRDHLANQRPVEALGAFRRGLALAEPIPLSQDLVAALRHHERVAERTQAARDLHLLVDRLRPFYGMAGLTPAEARRLEARCRQFWEQRDLIRQRLEPLQEPDLARQVEADLLDVAILWTDLSVRLAGEHPSDTRREALRVLDQAEELFGASCVLAQERRTHAAALKLPEPVAGLLPAPRTAWEHAALGRALLRAGDLSAAAQAFQQALERNPQDLWASFYSGTCAYRQARYGDAALAFQTCVALAPEQAWCFYNRGLAYLEWGRLDRALHDFDTALRLDSTLAAAAQGRGRLHYRAGRFAEARADLQQALDGGAAPAAVYYDFALVHFAQGDRAAALHDLEQALRHEPGHAEARVLRNRLHGAP